MIHFLFENLDQDDVGYSLQEPPRLKKPVDIITQREQNIFSISKMSSLPNGISNNSESEVIQSQKYFE